MSSNKQQSDYWRINVRVIATLLTIWAVTSCLCGIVFVEQLNQFSIGNLPLGFWIANQGSMLVFVVLILVYAVVMDVVDRRYAVSATEQGGESLDD